MYECFSCAKGLIWPTYIEFVAYMMQLVYVSGSNGIQVPATDENLIVVQVLL